MDVLVRDTNGNTLYNSNDSSEIHAASATWNMLRGSDIASAEVTFTDDFIIVTIAFEDD